MFMLNCSFHWSNIWKCVRNVFDATISHIMPLIVNELNFIPWTVDRSKDILVLWRYSYISLTLRLFLQFLLQSKSLSRQRIEFWLKLLQLEAVASVTYRHILTYYSSFYSFNGQDYLISCVLRQIILLTTIFCCNRCTIVHYGLSVLLVCIKGLMLQKIFIVLKSVY